MNEIVRTLADQDWGSKGAHLLAGRFQAAAQSIREHAEKLAQEAEQHGLTVKGISMNLSNSHVEGWSGPAEVNYSKQLERHSASGNHVSSELSQSAALLRQAGQEMANQLQSYASQVSNIGAGIDTALDKFAAGFEKVEDAIDKVFDSPVAALHQDVKDLSNNPLLRFAESL